MDAPYHPAAPATIRPATPADAEVLSALSRATFVETFGAMGYHPDDLAQFLEASYGLPATAVLLADPAHGAWLAERGGEAVGYAVAGPCGLPNPAVTPSCGELQRLYLRRHAQSGGIGAALMAAALAWLERDGPRPLWLGVWSGNHGAQRFYRRYGFSKVGEHTFPVGRTLDLEFTFRRPPSPEVRP